MHKLQEIMKNREEAGAIRGVYSACTANAIVIEAVCARAAATGTVALVEATANQVNQFGGYTGMTPPDFYDLAHAAAKQAGLDPASLILGGDHLGPLVWTGLEEKEAMENAKKLVFDFAAAGFTKIHIDTSMRLASDDQNARLADEVIARRGAELARQAEAGYEEYAKKHPDAPRPVYIIGSEVPVPGGASEEHGVAVTSPEDFKASVEAFRSAFEAAGQLAAWERVIGVVVQPGVEFGDDSVLEYDRDAAVELCAALKNYDGLVFEGHSTDYQTKYHLEEMVADGIAILKVGPGLTFAYREAMYALSHMEREIVAMHPELTASDWDAVLERAMLENPNNWAKYYRGTEAERAFKRKYSYSDRSRYYGADQNVKDAQDMLISNLNKTGIPLSLLSQFMPAQYTKVREGHIAADPESLVRDRVGQTVDEYLFALGVK